MTDVVGMSVDGPLLAGSANETERWWSQQTKKPRAENGNSSIDCGRLLLNIFDRIIGIVDAHWFPYSTRTHFAALFSRPGLSLSRLYHRIVPFDGATHGIILLRVLGKRVIPFHFVKTQCICLNSMGFYNYPAGWLFRAYICGIYNILLSVVLY